MKATAKKSKNHRCRLPRPEDDLRTALTVPDLKHSFLETLFCSLGRMTEPDGSPPIRY